MGNCRMKITGRGGGGPEGTRKYMLWLKRHLHSTYKEFKQTWTVRGCGFSPCSLAFLAKLWKKEKTEEGFP